MLGTALLLVAFQVGQPAQPPPPPPTGLILGRVVDSASGRPVAGAIVALQNVSMIMPGAPLPGPQPRAMTNANGQFVFRRLPKGAFGLTVTKPGYVDGAYGRRRPGGGQTSLELAEGERNGEVVIPMWRFAAISGTVTDEAGEPVVGVELRVFERRYLAGKLRVVALGNQLTDDRGAYRRTVPPGDYLIAFVSKEVTLPAEAAEILRGPSNPNDLKYQELSRERMSLAMNSSPVPSGLLTDGMERQVTPGTPILPQAATPGAPLYVYPTQFFPGRPSAAQATTLTLKSGQERSGVDFTLRPAKTMRVSGHVLGPEGPVGNVALRLVPEGDDIPTEMETSATMSGASGEFTFLGVLPGQYAVKVMRVPRPPTPPMSNVTSVQVGGSMIMTSSGNPGAAPPDVPAAPTLWASVAVGVTDTDVTGVSVVLQTGARLTGRLEFDGLKERPDAQALIRVPVMIERADRSVTPGTNIPPGRVDESGTFKTYGIPGGKYLVRVGSAPPGWTLRSIISEGRDISDTPFDVGSADVANILITFTDRQTKVTGVVRGASGNGDPDAQVVIFPADSAAWTGFGLNPRRMRSTRTAKTGAFTLGGLPPGEYILAAVKEENLGSWQYPEMLEALSRIGSQVRLSEGDTRAQDLKTGVVK